MKRALSSVGQTPAGLMNEDIAEQFADLASTLHDEPTVEATLDGVLGYACRAMGCTYVGVILLHGGKRLEVAAATDDRVGRLEALQTRLGEGPDLDVLGGGEFLLIRDATIDARWPRWSEGVAEFGLRSQLAVRMHTTATTVGTLNMYDDDPNAFDADDVGIAQLLARHAAIAIASAQDIENVWQAVDSRKLIGQAQGILMERYGLSADKAMAVLLRYSQDFNLKLRIVAERLVSTRLLPGRAAGTAADGDEGDEGVGA